MPRLSYEQIQNYGGICIEQNGAGNWRLHWPLDHTLLFGTLGSAKFWAEKRLNISGGWHRARLGWTTVYYPVVVGPTPLVADYGEWPPRKDGKDG